jgi:hypothetical protein
LSTPSHSLPRLGELRGLVERIRLANDRDDHRLADKLNGTLARMLAESPAHLLKTRELADWRFSAERREEGDARVSAALDELRSLAFLLGPSASWH